MTFHLEAVNGPDEAVDLVQAIGVAGMEAGVAIKPGTKVDLLLEVMRMCKTKDTQGKPSKNVNHADIGEKNFISPRLDIFNF